jgi:hypothetical protein
MSFIRENYNHVIEELKPHLRDHYKEVAMYQDHIEFDPDYDAYKELQKQDVLYLFTWREDGQLRGYNIFFVRPHPHYRSTTWAFNDVVYIAPEFRHTPDTIAFFDWCEDFLRDAGAEVITYHMKTFKSFQALMEVKEMDHAEHIYMKYIG